VTPAPDGTGLRRCIPALAGALLMLLVPAACADDVQTRTRIMPLGDSITDGYEIPGGYRIELWRMLAARDFTVDFVGSERNGPDSLPDKDHEGHNGWLIDQIHASVRTWLPRYRPDVVLLLIGTNDMWQHYRVANAPARLGALIDEIHALRPASRILVSTLPPAGPPLFNRRVAKYNAAIRQVVSSRAAAGRPVSLVDAGGRLTRVDLADGVHPNAVGYRKLAQAWDAALAVRALARRSDASSGG
jgi:lysophospholipase L1-like esterase